jgi:hypothetical protein
MAMKRLIVALCLLLPAGAALAFDPAPATLRIGILRAPDRPAGEFAHRILREALRDELKSRGVDAFVVEADLEQLRDDEARDADFYVDLLGGTDVREHGGVGVSGRHADVSLGVVSSRMDADLFVYDGHSLELIAEETLSKKNTALLPTGVGVGGRSLFAWVALPFVERAQARSVGRAVGRQMADVVIDAVRTR